jgi:hypothetical protein
MRQFLSVVGPIAGNFLAWPVITILPLHPVITFTLVIASGVLILCGIVYFRAVADRDRPAPCQSGSNPIAHDP